jgi:hypothetical protein
MAIYKRGALQTARDYQVSALKLRREGFTYAEIAERLGTTVAEVRELTDFSRLSMDEITRRLAALMADVISGDIRPAQANVLRRAYGDEIKKFDPRTGSRRARAFAESLAPEKGE